MALEQIVLRRKGVGTPISRAIAVSIQHVTSREGRDKTDFFPLHSPWDGVVFRDAEMLSDFSSPGYVCA